MAVVGPAAPVFRRRELRSQTPERFRAALVAPQMAASEVWGELASSAPD